jgi:hypothetical protein
MKKFILGLSIGIVLVSCSKNADQIDVVKKDLKSKNISDIEIDMYTFNVTELLGKDAYDLTFKKYWDREQEFQSESTLQILDTLVKSKHNEIIKTKKFHKVDCFRITDRDTVAHSIYFLTDKNKIYDCSYIK